MEFGIRPGVLDEIRQLAETYHIEKVILFGSRARGDYKRTSDIDLAVSGGDVVQFALAVVDLDGPVQDELRQSIEREGIVIYEKVR